MLTLSKIYAVKTRHPRFVINHSNERVELRLHLLNGQPANLMKIEQTHRKLAMHLQSILRPACFDPGASLF
jgi:hypothetical protein